MKQAEIDYWIRVMLAAHDSVSDLNITVGRTLQVETDGQLKPVTTEPEISKLTPFQTEVFALNLINGNRHLLRDLIRNGSCDLSYALDDGIRFRVNIFSQQGYLTTILRRLETSIPSIEEKNFPACFQKMAGEHNGLILFTGATGSGKSTSLAALLHKINQEQTVHVLTLEDPIEYVHPHIQATVNQRELGNDFSDFPTGLRAALRQAPKVILVGEIRDRETLEIVLTAAETGHLVLSTLHTIDAGQTISRILGMFEQEDEAQIRNRLAGSIRWIVAQRLLPKIGGGRVAAMEILYNSLRIQDLILNGEDEDENKNYHNVIQEGSAKDMRTFDQHILELYGQGLISKETALSYGSHRNEIARGIDQSKARQGESTSTLTDLSMEEEKQDDPWTRKQS